MMNDLLKQTFSLLCMPLWAIPLGYSFSILQRIAGDCHVIYVHFDES
jgi:hypothetical protein